VEDGRGVRPAGGEWFLLVKLALGLSLLALFNSERATRHEAPLKLDPALTYAAQIKAGELERCGFVHDACGRPWFVDLPRRAWLGENIASGYTSPTAVVEGWVESPRHRANITRRQFRRVGFARVGTFYVAEFSS
jgi:uncharacterized protein YkwD